MQNFPFEIILDWYKKNGRHNLPWRQIFDFSEKDRAYRVWLSEVMLQQTQVERCKVFYENITQNFPNIESLAGVAYEEFFPYYKGLGYYSRARNMLKAAKIVSEQYDGFFPKERDKLLKISGIGSYTAEAIRAFAYDIPTLSFDTNLLKIFSRFYYGNRFHTLTVEEKEDLNSQLKKGGFSGREINAALMDFASFVDLNSLSQIDFDTYPLKESEFYKTKGRLEPIKVKKKSSFPTKEAHVICILHENHKKYFFVKKDILPFYIGTYTKNPRAMIQEYFIKKFNIEVSVRPPEIMSYAHETPYLISYAQIQRGSHNFIESTEIKVRGNEEGIIENYFNNCE